DCRHTEPPYRRSTRYCWVSCAPFAAAMSVIPATHDQFSQGCSAPLKAEASRETVCLCSIQPGGCCCLLPPKRPKKLENTGRETVKQRTAVKRSASAKMADVLRITRL